ncbi:carbohydrate esterase family 1 protein [Daldinia bambusicola]|nr:carbohydrate esterase family 1 protein [Daldinia bambusicola]
MRSSAIIRSIASLGTCLGARAALTPITNWGTNPTNLQVQAYIPSKLAESPAVILALHTCGGSAAFYHMDANYDQYADQKGFIVVYPSTTKDSNCWDVASTKSLTYEGGGDSTGLANLVKYMITKYNADPKKIFAVGSSSGCMMTNVLLATYPDLFNAGSCYSGIPAGCLAGSPGSSPQSADPTCANGRNIKTGAQWAQQAKAMRPGWNGTYPRLQTFHGSADTFVSYTNFGEQLKQWSTIHGLSFTGNTTNSPRAGDTKMVYGDGTVLVGISVANTGHPVRDDQQADLAWFGLL